MSGSVSEARRARFTLLGPLTVRADTGTVALGGVRAQCLLAALLLRAGMVTSVEALIDAAWAAAPPAGARVLVQNRISALRRVLRDAGLGAELITTVGSGYLFHAEEGMLDLELFDRRLVRADELIAAGAAAEAASELAAALALWRGPALDGLATPPIAAAANQLEERRIRALKQRIALDLGQNRHAALVGELTGLVGEHPYQEDLRGLLMVALERSGRPAEALGLYRDTWRVFTEQLGIEPSPALSRLQDAILRDEPVGLTDLSGLANLFGPGRFGTERFGAARFGAASQVHAVPAHPPVPRQLPPAPGLFTGRGAELRQLDALLTGGQDPAPARITTIDGMAGVGKSALALHWAHRTAHRFPDGQLYVDLRGDDPAPRCPVDALGSLLESLGHARADIPAGVDRAAARYRSCLAGRRTLIVLDNVGSVDQVRPLLPGSPGSVVLITSRNRLSGLLARAGAGRITLDVLRPVEAQWLLTGTLGADRVRAEPYATTSLAALCGYLPLALCAAAANFAEGRHECVADQVAELRGEISPGGPRSAGTGGPVRAALEPSYRGLPARARRLLRLLGLVPGADFTTAAAAALAGLDLAAAESSLDRLAAVHLIHEHAPGRFRLHLLVRQYAVECARRAEDDTERAGAVRRLLGWYLRHARAAVAWFDAADADPDELVFGEPDRAAGWLAAEWGNLAAAVRHGPDPLAGLLGDTLRGYLDATVGHTGRVDRLARWWGELPRQLSRGEPETARTVLVPRR